MGIGGYRWVEGGYRWVPPGSPPPYHPRSLLVEKIFFMESFQYIAVGFLWVICGLSVGFLWVICEISLLLHKRYLSLLPISEVPYK